MSCLNGRILEASKGQVIDVVFIDRVDAGRQLATRLQHLRGEKVVVLGLPRGGVPVAAEVARALDAPLDVILVRKVGVPFHPEVGMGAIGEGGVRIANDEVIRAARVTTGEFLAVEERERRELERRAALYRGDRPRVSLVDRTAVLVDDGIATGSTARAACQVARELGARRVVLAAPIAPRRALDELGQIADEMVFVDTPVQLQAVGQWYRDFSATSDAEVIALLRRSLGGGTTPRNTTPVDLVVDGTHLVGDLTVPERAMGLVVFAHGSGSSRRSPRNQYVAEVLNDAGFTTLLFDLLTSAEEENRANVFDIRLLGSRLAGVTRWARSQPRLRDLPIGLFGASTGAGAALWAAAEPDLPVAAVVSRGGRPDLAGRRVESVRAPTLLIVGERDEIVIALNERVARELRCEHRLVIVRGATHVFPERGALETVARVARDWFVEHLARDTTMAPELGRGA